MRGHKVFYHTDACDKPQETYSVLKITFFVDEREKEAE